MMLYAVLTKLVQVLLLSSVANTAPHAKEKRASLLPLTTKGRDILDAAGNIFHYKSTNWPGKSHWMRLMIIRLT